MVLFLRSLKRDMMDDLKNGFEEKREKNPIFIIK
jgi:hypothetical protein